MQRWMFLFMAGLTAAVSTVQAQPRRAQSAPQPPPASATTSESARVPAGTGVHADYQIYVHGLRIGRLEAGLELQAATYRLELAFQTFGLVGWLFRGHQLDISEGRVARQLLEPSRYSGQGFWRGEPRRVLIDYIGRQPVVRNLEPPNDAEREPVPAQLQANSLDTLSAMVTLIHRIADTGRCDSVIDTFDGRRAVRFNARTVGEADLEPTGRSSFQGRALRCDFNGTLMAGYRLADPPEERGVSRHGSAWFAPVVPGAPLLPVRLEFETSIFGDATIYLIGAGPGAARDPPDE